MPTYKKRQKKSYSIGTHKSIKLDMHDFLIDVTFICKFMNHIKIQPKKA